MERPDSPGTHRTPMNDTASAAGFAALVERLRSIDPSIDGPHLRELDALYCYRLLLGRLPDPSGWNFWKERIARGISLGEAVFEFQKSDEARARWSPRPQLLETKRGFSMFVDPSDPTACRAIVATREYEPNVSAFVARELDGAHGTFVDIGANVGWYMMLAHTVAPQLRVVGFEPNPANLQLCYRTFEHAKFADAVLHPVALSDSRCFLGLNFSGSNGSVEPLEGRATIVQGVMGDDYLTGESRIALVKLDVEGHEPRALRGLARTLERHRPVLVSEFHPACLRQNAGVEPGDYLDQVLAQGYVLSVLSQDARGRELPCRDRDAVLAEWRGRSAAAGSDTLHMDIVARPRG
jgi:FkbM family methyltransferase